MILQALTHYYETLSERGEIAPPYFLSTGISAALALSPDGRLIGVVPLKHSVQRGKRPSTCRNCWTFRRR